jgi:hypothetical protein
MTAIISGTTSNVYFIQTAALEKVRGLNLNKCYPVHEMTVVYN